MTKEDILYIFLMFLFIFIIFCAIFLEIETYTVYEDHIITMKWKDNNLICNYHFELDNTTTRDVSSYEWYKYNIGDTFTTSNIEVNRKWRWEK